MIPIKLRIIYEDKQIVVVDKPAGLVVNRATTVKGPTLQDQLSDYFKLGSDLGIGGRAGIVHRLDRETSGLLLVAKTQKAFDFLQEQFGMREVQKEYIALVHGFVSQKEGEITAAIGRIGKFGKFGIVDHRSAEGREAKTNYKAGGNFQHKVFRGRTPKGVRPLEGSEGMSKSRIRYLQNHARDYTLLSVYPKTGRTHQVRVHLKSIGHAVVSDKIYTPNKLLKFDLGWCPRLFLHAASIEFKHPATKKIVKFKSPLPKELGEALEQLTTDN